MKNKTGKKNNLPPVSSEKTDWPWSDTTQSEETPQEHEGDWPKISIVTPSYNQGQFIEKTIRSVLLQNYPNLEYIIIDGASTDQTVDVIKKYEKHLTYWISEKDEGQPDAINKGFSRATGKIFAWLNSDDYYLPGTLFKVAEAFRDNQKAEVLVGKGHKVLETGEIKYTPSVPELNFEAFLDWSYSHFMQPSCFFKAKAWKECGPLREDLYFCLDVDLWLKMSQKYRFAKIEDSLSHAIIHPDAKTTAETERMIVETSLLVIQYGATDIARKNLMKLADQNYKLKNENKTLKSRTLKGILSKVKNKLLFLLKLMKKSFNL